MNELMAERIARNDAAFRRANEGIADTAYEFDVGDQRIPFICECADRDCNEIVQLSVAEYESIRADSTHFMNVPGHQVAAQGWGVVVAENDRFVVVEKIGRAGEVVERLDERQAAGDKERASSDRSGRSER
jgi:hypothetical protein